MKEPKSVQTYDFRTHTFYFADIFRHAYFLLCVCACVRACMHACVHETETEMEHLCTLLLNVHYYVPSKYLLCSLAIL